MGKLWQDPNQNNQKNNTRKFKGILKSVRKNQQSQNKNPDQEKSKKCLKSLQRKKTFMILMVPKIELDSKPKESISDSDTSLTHQVIEGKYNNNSKKISVT